MPDLFRHDSLTRSLRGRPAILAAPVFGGSWVGVVRVKPAMTARESTGFRRSARKSKAACGWTAPRNQDTSPGLFAIVAPQDVRGAARRIASCARHLARESCLNIATKERREFFRGAPGANRPGSRRHRRVPRATCPRGAVQLHAALPPPDRGTRNVSEETRDMAHRRQSSHRCVDCGSSPQ